MPVDRLTTFLVILIHGFKGDADTFGSLAADLARAVNDDDSTYVIETYPAYETRGSLANAVENLGNWLSRRVAELNESIVRVCLLGHSMAGIVASDLALSQTDLPIDIVIALDSPFLGLSPNTLTNKVGDLYEQGKSLLEQGLAAHALGQRLVRNATKADVNQATTPISSSAVLGWKGVSALVAASATALAGGVYSQRERIVTGQTWVTEHLEFVSCLTGERAALRDRLARICTNERIRFAWYYTVIDGGRRFCTLPDGRAHTWLHAVRNLKARDEIAAHRGMFSPDTNDGYTTLLHDLVAELQGYGTGE
ncbi:hypothetical protein PYCC9005_005245 [Savitreella phatthalungensis]